MKTVNRNFEDDKDALNAPKYIPRTDDLSVRRDGSTLAHRALIVTGVVVAVLLVLFLLWYAVDVLLLAFAGILLAVFLRGLSDKLGERTGLSENWTLAVVILSLVALIG
ncbi:MAG: hypothetical protein LC742_11710, partial [Acidobacteria bacterium]|nr:hypothetical protein [Acidobacteriota bacterium]